MGKTQYIELEKIRTEGLQTRAQISMDAVREYATEERERGAVFPPLTVFHDGAAYWLADGFHRLGAARQNGKKKVACEVREGIFADALRHALTANAVHGMRRTNMDKHKAVMTAYENRRVLGLPDVPSARLIAELVGVSDVYATNQLLTVSSWRQATERTGADGKTRVLPPPPVRRSVPQERAGNGTDGIDGGGQRTEDRGGAVGSRLSAVGNGKMQGDKAEGGRMMAEGETERTEKRLAASRQTGEGGVTTLNAERSTPNAQVSRDSSPPVRRPVSPPPVRRDAAGGPVDGRGREVPPDLLEIWNRRGEARELAGLVSRVRVALRDAQDGKDPLWAEINFGSALAHLDMAYKEIAAAEPWCVCPMCQGIGCEACRGRGLMGKYRYDNVVPESMKRG